MNLKIYHTSKHNTTITLYPFPYSDSFYQGGVSQSKGIKAKTIQKCCTLNDNALATVSQSVGRSLVQTIFRSTLSSGKFTCYSILKHKLQMIKNFISISPSTSTQWFTCESLHPHIDPSLILVGGSFLMVSFSFPGEITIL